MDDVLLIVRHERTYADGCFGLHARGNARLRNLRAYRYLGPQGADTDWTQRVLPRHLLMHQR